MAEAFWTIWPEWAGAEIHVEGEVGRDAGDEAAAGGVEAVGPGVELGGGVVEVAADDEAAEVQVGDLG